MTTPAPVEGAVRIYPLVPASEPDPGEWVTNRLKARGWEVVDIVAFDTEHTSSIWMGVDLWAIPPNWAEIKARREARKKVNAA